MKKFTSKIIILAGVILFIIIAYVIIKNTSTKIAVVPNQNLSAGTTITSEMLMTITVPSNTPKGFITDPKAVIGQKLKVNVSEGQFLYVNDVMTSWDKMLDGEKIPDNYIITSIYLPSERAVGGLINTGDCIDLLGVPKNTYLNVEPKQMQEYLGDMALYDSYGTDMGVNLYWILANVKILQTNSMIAQSENSTLSNLNDENGQATRGNGSYYIVALSYPDYQKLQLAQVYLNCYMSLCPPGNEANGPLYDQMRQHTIKALQDAQFQPDEYLYSDGGGDYKWPKDEEENVLDPTDPLYDPTKVEERTDIPPQELVDINKTPRPKEETNQPAATENTGNGDTVEVE